MKKILIVGANFNNKGAQSMLFTTISEIRKRNSDTEIYFATTETIEENVYSFKKVSCSYNAKQIAFGNKALYLRCKCFVKDIIKYICGRHTNLWQYKQLKKLLTKLDLIIDISGFSLGEKWEINTQENYLDHIRLARQYNIPMILMPQSFGPFTYIGDKEYLLGEIRKELAYPRVIFAREKEGYDALIQGFGLTNIRMSSDLVLQSQDINIESIYKKNIQLNVPNISESNAVGIIPNNQCFRHGNKEAILALYKKIIEELLVMEKEVYIFRHSGEDLESCREIYMSFNENSHVLLLQDDFSCLEYNALVKKFQFIICSRFHGVVHAYRNSIPCVILGWAVKYNELANLVDQEQYVFNIVDEEIDDKKILDAIKNMMGSYVTESAKIKERVKEIQKDNCFEVLNEFL